MSGRGFERVGARLSRRSLSFPGLWNSDETASPRSIGQTLMHMHQSLVMNQIVGLTAFPPIKAFPHDQAAEAQA